MLAADSFSGSVHLKCLLLYYNEQFLPDPHVLQNPIISYTLQPFLRKPAWWDCLTSPCTSAFPNGNRWIHSGFRGLLQGMKLSVSLLVGYLSEDELSPATGREEGTETYQAVWRKGNKVTDLSTADRLTFSPPAPNDDMETSYSLWKLGLWLRLVSTSS